MGGFLSTAVLALILGFEPLSHADLATAQELYAAASYEEALQALSALGHEEDNADQVNELRVLCLLALGRTLEAEHAVEAIVMHDPQYDLARPDVSPKLATLFHAVRRRTLPTAVRALYERGKGSYDAKRWAEARDDFEAILALGEDADVAPSQTLFRDVSQLAEGFLRLTEEQMAAAAAVESRSTSTAATVQGEREELKQSAVGTEVAVGSESGAPGDGPSPSLQTLAPTIYSALDQDVFPPVELARTMPPWTPTSRAMAVQTHIGLLEVVVDETGAVESARVLKSVTPSYDHSLTRAARSWRYTPAKRGGQPVRYRQVLEIVLRASP
jgi:TonB family protein